MASDSRPYHHGHLRPALIDAAVATVEDQGPAATSLRGVARRAGVSHAAATYHFGDKAGLLTAVAAEGYRRLAEALRAEDQASHSYLEIGVAYVRFAVNHRGYFEVMYRPELFHPQDPALLEARAAAASELYRGDQPDADQMATGIAAWALMHGVATLWLNGNMPPPLGDDPEAIARLVAKHLDVAVPGEPGADRLRTFSRAETLKSVAYPVFIQMTSLPSSPIRP
ncbi:MAG TPA: TetR/AcrR family transcriptional regulator [Streptosporangiaceae bacterium]